MKNIEETPEYVIEKLCETNIADVEKLHTAVYDTVPARNLFLMKYDTAFTGVKHIGFIAYDQRGQPAAFYCVIPCFIRFKDKIVLSAQSADTMTHPDHRFKGLFVELALRTFQLCETAGIQFVFGFPNQNSLPGFVNKLGWETTERMDCFIIRSVIFPWKKIFYKFPVLKNRLAAYQQGVLKNHAVNQQGLSNSVFEDGFAGVYRDHHFRKYKTYHQSHVIKLGNALLWVKINSVLLIGDILVKPGEFEGMLYRLKSLASKLGIREIHFHASPGTTLHKLFARDYQPIPSFPVIFKSLGEHAALETVKFTSADIDTF